MTGWIVAAALYGLGTFILYVTAKEPPRKRVRFSASDWFTLALWPLVPIAAAVAELWDWLVEE